MVTEDQDDNIPAAAVRMGERLRAIIRSATCHTPGVDVTTALRCHRRPKRRGCNGYIVINLREVPPNIDYHCSACSDGGTISGWRGSREDQSQIEATGSVICQVHINDEEYKHLQDVFVVDSAAQRIVWAARHTRKYILLEGAVTDMDELAGYVAATANHAPNKRIERILDRVFEAMSIVLEKYPNER
jgi:hypothetical protein